MLIFMSIFILPYPSELVKVLIIQAAMPAALFPVVISKYYQGSPSVAIKVAISSSLVGFITIPVIVNLGLRFFV